MKRYLAIGEIVVGAGIVILSVSALPLWAGILGLAFVALGIGGLPAASHVIGSDTAPDMGGRIAGALLILGFIVWLAWPEQNWKGAVDVTLSALPGPSGQRVTSPPQPKTATKPRASNTVPARERTRASKAADAQLATFSAKHRHRLRDCEGVLTLTADTVRFDSKDHNDSFVYSIDEVEVHKDGVRDRLGKAWHFRVEGHDMEDVLKRWKTEALTAQNIRVRGAMSRSVNR